MAAIERSLRGAGISQRPATARIGTLPTRTFRNHFISASADVNLSKAKLARPSFHAAVGWSRVARVGRTTRRNFASEETRQSCLQVGQRATGHEQRVYPSLAAMIGTGKRGKNPRPAPAPPPATLPSPSRTASSSEWHSPCVAHPCPPLPRHSELRPGLVGLREGSGGDAATQPSGHNHSYVCPDFAIFIESFLRRMGVGVLSVSAFRSLLGLQTRSPDNISVYIQSRLAADRQTAEQAGRCRTDTDCSVLQRARTARGHAIPR